MIQALEFTPAEAAALVDLSEKEVRKEIEYRIIDTASSHDPLKNAHSSVINGSPLLGTGI